MERNFVMIHLYCGNGKGKTTAAMGLALRAAGRGERVVIAQFLKGADSGERYALAQLPRWSCCPCPKQVKFTLQMDEQERREAASRCQALLAQARERAKDCFLLVLDEACAAVNSGLLPLEELLDCLDSLTCEVVLTGRDPAPQLLERADYITQMEPLRHPYQRGVTARKGIEW